MGQAIPTQHPAVVLRSHYTHVRLLLAIAMVAVVGLSVAVVILAGAEGRGTSSAPAAGRSAPSTVLAVPPRVAPPIGRRYDGGPEEGTRGIVAHASNRRYDGGPNEGSRGPGH